MKRKQPKRLLSRRPYDSKVRRARIVTRAALSKTSPITKARVRAGLSIAQLADRAGVSFATVWRAETGSTASAVTYRTLMQALRKA